jgi:hypothetical protein
LDWILRPRPPYKGKEGRPRRTHLQSRIDTWSRIDPAHRLAHAISFNHSQIQSAHHCNSPNYTSNTSSDKQDVGLYPPGGRTWVNSCVPLFLSEAVESAKCPHTLHWSKALKHGHCRVRTPSRTFKCYDTVGHGLLFMSPALRITLAADPKEHHASDHVWMDRGHVPAGHLKWIEALRSVHVKIWAKNVVSRAAMHPSARSSCPPRALPLVAQTSHSLPPRPVALLSLPCFCASTRRCHRYSCPPTSAPLFRRTPPLSSTKTTCTLP